MNLYSEYYKHLLETQDKLETRKSVIKFLIVFLLTLSCLQLVGFIWCFNTYPSFFIRYDHEITIFSIAGMIFYFIYVMTLAFLISTTENNNDFD